MAVRCSHCTRHNLYVYVSPFSFLLVSILDTNLFAGAYPFQEDDPFVLQSCPHIFFTGNQPKFDTRVIEGEIPLRLDGGAGDDTEMTDAADRSSARVRLLSLPKFGETGELVLVDTETLEVEVVRFGVFGGQEEKK